MLFSRIVYLIGNKNDPKGTKMRQINQETQCRIKINFDDSNPHQELAPPMTITVTAQNRNTAQEDLKLARRKIEDLFLNFVHNDKTKGTSVSSTSDEQQLPHQQNQSKLPNVPPVVIEVPLWLQRDCQSQRALFCKFTLLHFASFW